MMSDVENLDDEYVCPACLCGEFKDLTALSEEYKSVFQCAKCKRLYPMDKHGIIDFQALDQILKIPDPYLSLWALAQNASLEEYKQLSPASISTKEREIVIAFKEFLDFDKDAKVLDIGSGTDYLPGYISPANLRNYTALDPLPVCKPVEFRKVKAWAEQMPFADCYFDVAILATSLDHILCLHSFFSELNRVLKPGASVYFWGAWYFDDTVLKNFNDKALIARLPDKLIRDSQDDIFVEYEKNKAQIDGLINNDIKDKYLPLMKDRYHFRHIPVNFFKIFPQQYAFNQEAFYIWDININNYINGFIKLRKNAQFQCNDFSIAHRPFYLGEILKLKEELKTQTAFYVQIEQKLENIMRKFEKKDKASQFISLIKRFLQKNMDEK